MKTIFLAFATCGLVAAAATPAAAQSMMIEYSDLNLETEKGQRVLANRIDRAARALCNYEKRTTGSHVRSNDSARCYEAAKKSASEQFARLVDDSRLGG